jgi:hypothetical protein
MALLCRFVLDSTDSCRRGKGCCAIDPLASQEVAKLREEHLEQLGWFVKIFVVAGSHFRCASSRLRLILVAFRDKAALARFTPPPPQANAPTPLCTVLKPFSMATGRTAGESLFIEANKFNMASERSHVVSRGYLHGAHSFTSSYGSLQTPGTLLCEAAEYSTRETPLSVAEIKHLSTGELRRLRDLRVPFGGAKRSGLGREGGEDALRLFTEPKSISWPA